MARNEDSNRSSSSNQNRQRDDQGQFTPDGTKGRSGASGSAPQSRSGIAQGRERDEQGRFVADDDTNASGRGSSGARSGMRGNTR